VQNALRTKLSNDLELRDKWISCPTNSSRIATTSSTDCVGSFLRESCTSTGGGALPSHRRGSVGSPTRQSSQIDGKRPYMKYEQLPDPGGSRRPGQLSAAADDCILVSICTAPVYPNNQYVSVWNLIQEHASHRPDGGNVIREESSASCRGCYLRPNFSERIHGYVATDESSVGWARSLPARRSASSIAESIRLHIP